MANRLFHFSDDPGIATFVPRPVRTPVDRSVGQEWLNGPLVWAIDEAHSALYLFPRDCPRIVISRSDDSSAADIDRYWRGSSKPMLAFVEAGWVERIQCAKLYRYTFKRKGFIDLGDVGMHVTDREVTPTEVTVLSNLFDALTVSGVEVRAVPDLSGLKNAWDSTLQVSGIRLRNAVNWDRDLFWLRPPA